MPVTMPSILIACHVCVLGAATWVILSLGLGPAGIGAALLLGVAPLSLAFNGLRAASRYTQQWLAIAMVFLVGFSLAEAIASEGHSRAAMALLLASAAELILLLRQLRSAAPASHESAES